MGGVMTWAVVAVLAASSIVAAIGTPSNVLGATFQLPPLRAGDRFVYDAIVEDERGATRQAGVVAVAIGRPHSVHLMDRTEVNVLPVTTTRSAAFWDAEAAPQTALAQRDTRSTEWVRLDDGAIVFADHLDHALTWTEPDDPPVLRARTEYSARFDGVGGPVAEQLLTLQENTFHYSPFNDHSAVAGDGPAVRAIATTAVVDANGSRACTTPLPAVAYEAAPSAGGVAMRAVAEEAWVSAAAAVPIVTSCRVTEFDAQHGEVARFTFSLVLGAIEPGDDPIRLAGGARYSPNPAVVAEKAVVPGMPEDGVANFRLELPIRDAVRDLEEEQEGPLAAFRDAGDVPFRVVSASYRPGPWSCASASAPWPSGTDPGELCFGSDGFRMRYPTWEFVLVNEAGDRLRAGVVRTIVDGTPVQDHVWSQRAENEDGLDETRLPEQLAPVLPILADWLPRWATTYEMWTLARDAAIRIDYSPTETGPDGTYVGRVAISGEGHAPAQPKRSAADAAAGRCGPDLGWSALPVVGCASERGAAAAGPASLPTHAWVHTYRPGDGVYLARAYTNLSVTRGPIPPAPRTMPGPGTPLEDAPAVAAWGAAGGVAALSLAGLRYAIPAVPRWARRLLALALYAHVAKEKALDHPTRRDLMAVVQGDPGVTTKELCRRLDIGWGTAVYHLGVLEQNGFLVSHRGGRYRGWFLQGSDPTSRQRAATLRSMAAQRVMRYVRERPGCTQREMARAFGVDHVAVIFHARRLEDAGLLRKERKGRTVHYFATDAAVLVGAASTP